MLWPQGMCTGFVESATTLQPTRMMGGLRRLQMANLFNMVYCFVAIFLLLIVRQKVCASPPPNPSVFLFCHIC